MDAALVAEDVRKTYGDVRALAGVSLSVDVGEVFGLIGPNGAGKTTLVRALTGTTRVEGEVSVLDEAPTRVDRSRIGLLPQAFTPPERLTPRELLSYYAGLYDDPRRIGPVLADVGLDDAADTRYGKLSGGQRRRTCVGAALVNDPAVLFLDEPTTGIDPAGRRSLWRLLESLADGGTTVFLTSHSMREVERLADRVGLLSAGELVATGPPRELVAEHGGRSRLVVEAADAAGAAERLRRETGFDVRVDGGAVVLVGVAPAGIGDAIEALEASGVGYDALRWAEPSLEDAYLRLTGEPFEGSRRRSVPVDGDEDAGVAVDGGPERRRAFPRDGSAGGAAGEPTGGSRS